MDGNGEKLPRKVAAVLDFDTFLELDTEERGQLIEELQHRNRGARLRRENGDAVVVDPNA